MNKKGDIKSLKSKNARDLAQYLEENQELLRVSRFDLANGNVKSISRIKETKKTIARIKTFVNLLNSKNNTKIR